MTLQNPFDVVSFDFANEICLLFYVIECHAMYSLGNQNTCMEEKIIIE